MSSYTAPPLVSISLTLASIAAFSYNFSYYSLRRIDVNNNSSSSFWCITKPIQMKQQQEGNDNNTNSSTHKISEAIYHHDRLYIVKDTKLVHDDNHHYQSSYSIKKLIAQSNDFISLNNDPLVELKRKKDNLWRYLPQRDSETSFAIDENRLLMWDDAMESDFQKAEIISHKKERTEDEAFIRGTFGQFLPKQQQAEEGTDKIIENLIKKNNNNNNEIIFDTPQILKSNLTWKSQVHEEPAFLIGAVDSEFAKRHSTLVRFNFLNKFFVFEFDQDDATKLEDRRQLIKYFTHSLTLMENDESSTVVSRNMMKRVSRRTMQKSEWQKPDF